MKHLRFASCALAALGFAHCVAAAPAGTLLFTQPGTQIVNDSGRARPAAKGDVLQIGERLVTPAGAISQVLLPDGSLIAMRPESELKIDAAPSGSDNKAPVVNLINGTARVINAELMDAKRASNFTLQSGTATVKLKSADMESAVVKADGKSAAGDAAPGSYQRLVMGTGTVTNGSQMAPLTPRQVSYAAGANAAPVTVAAPSQNLFGGNSGRGPGQQTAGNGNTNTGTPPRQINVGMPLKSIAPPPPPVAKPCTRFIGKTCIQ